MLFNIKEEKSIGVYFELEYMKKNNLTIEESLKLDIEKIRKSNKNYDLIYGFILPIISIFAFSYFIN